MILEHLSVIGIVINTGALVDKAGHLLKEDVNSDFSITLLK